MVDFNNIQFKVATQFFAVFQITRKIIFEVRYNVREDGSSYFSTQAALFNQPKTDYRQCGQCQQMILPHGSRAYHFYNKWDKYHCKPITDEKVWKELIDDVKTLAEYYNNAIKDKFMNFSICYEVSMLPLKTKGK